MLLTTNNREKVKTKTDQGERISEVIIEMGHTERSFALQVGYKHASTIYAAEYGRKLSPKLLKKITDGYEDILKKRLNPQWLLVGTLPKLLTENIREISPDFIEEPVLTIGQTCKNCIEKDKIIDILTLERNDLLRDYNNCLKEVLMLKKAASR